MSLNQFDEGYYKYKIFFGNKEIGYAEYKKQVWKIHLLSAIELLPDNYPDEIKRQLSNLPALEHFNSTLSHSPSSTSLFFEYYFDRV